MFQIVRAMIYWFSWPYSTLQHFMASFLLRLRETNLWICSKDLRIFMLAMYLLHFNVTRERNQPEKTRSVTYSTDLELG